MTIIDISNKYPAAVLAALYNAAKSPMEVFFQLSSPQPSLISEEDAEKIIENYGNHFEYLYNIPLKIDLSHLKLDVTEYDKIYGNGTAQKAIDSCPDI